jgi:hypothetical protein
MCDVVLSLGGASAAKLFEPAVYAKIHRKNTSSDDSVPGSVSGSVPAHRKKEV